MADTVEYDHFYTLIYRYIVYLSFDSYATTYLSLLIGAMYQKENKDNFLIETTRKNALITRNCVQHIKTMKME